MLRPRQYDAQSPAPPPPKKKKNDHHNCNYQYLLNLLLHQQPTGVVNIINICNNLITYINDLLAVPLIILIIAIHHLIHQLRPGAPDWPGRANIGI